MVKKKTGVSTGVKIGAAAAILASITGSILFISNGKSKLIQVPAYSVARVIDGDTFVTAEKQIIRLASTEAPELDQCGGPEAKKALEKLILGKPVYLKGVFTDPYRRFVSFVYTQDGFVNEAMLRGGYSYLQRKTSAEVEEQLGKASDEARKNKKGIFGKTCTQDTNEKNPSCNIKGNIQTGRFYYTPDCTMYYDQTQMQLYLGDRWFCSERDAQKAGFRKSSQCP